MDFLKIFVVIIFILLDGMEMKIFTRCHLTKELLKYDFQKNVLSTWVCLIEHESGKSTSKVIQQPNSSASYGLFQINSKMWCRKNRKGGLCNMKCKDFLNDDIHDDVRCAKIIYRRLGFQAWHSWQYKCRGRNLLEISNC